MSDATTPLTAQVIEGSRLDKFLAVTFSDFSRVRLQKLIAEGHVTVDGRPETNASLKVKAGQTIALVPPPPEPATPTAEDIALDIVFEDRHLIVINKPPGLVVHPAAGHASGTLVNALLAHCGDSLSGIGGVKRPGIVHRLDKDTSGLLVVAKNDKAHLSLSEQFAAHGRDGNLQRSYLALVWGIPARKTGTVSARLARSTNNRLKIAVTKSETAGREAITHYEVIENFGDVASLLRCNLETGRTHQIRVHMAHIGHPVLGDATYGSGFKSSATRLSAGSRLALEALQQQALHAESLGFKHPATHKHMLFSVQPTAAFVRLLLELRKQSKLSIKS